MIKIVFLCGSADLGKNGVLDYTMLLAASLSENEQQVRVVILDDRSVESLIFSTHVVNGINVPVLRLPSFMSTEHRFEYAATFIKDFNPDWISLQYVPFSFQKKGLPFGLGKKLRKIGKGYRWQIMFHEMWVGRAAGASFKQKGLSYLQQIIIKQLCKTIRPEVVHTHLPAFKFNLKKIGFSAKPLPLFSNIIPATTLKKEQPEKLFRFAFFSQAEISDQIIDFINQMILQVKTRGFLPELIFIGGNNHKMDQLSKKFKQAFPFIENISCTGFIDSANVSKILATCNLGITPVPIHALGKSGSIAAFISHGIPVAAPVIEKAYSKLGIGFFNSVLKDAILLQPDWDLYQLSYKATTLAAKEINLSTVANLFCNDLLTA
jgi:hypothetical protein